MATEINCLGKVITEADSNRALLRYREAVKRPLLYVAGPMISYGNPYQNVTVAIHAGKYARELGWQPILPQLNAFLEMAGDCRTPDEWLQLDYQLIAACNAILFLDGSVNSSGANEEANLLVAVGRFRKMPRYVGTGALPSAAYYWQDQDE